MLHKLMLMRRLRDAGGTTLSFRIGLKTALPAFISVSLLIVLPHRANGQVRDPGEQITAEAKRLERRVPALELPENEAKAYLDGLKLVQLTVRSGHELLALYYLQPLQLAVTTYDYHRSKASVIAKGGEAFEAEWRSLGEQLNAKEKTYAAERGQTPAAVMALAEASLTLVRPYYQSAHLYGLNRTISEGIFYMGRAPASLDFALFCRQQNFKSAQAPLKVRSIEPELAGLEAETLAAHEQSENKDLRPFINTNVTMKIAGDLNREQRYFGALLKYLDACLALHLLKAAPPDPAQLEALRKQLDALHNQLLSEKTDDSIGLLYWEMAQRALQPAAEDQISPDDLKRAVVVIHDVLPSYFKIIAALSLRR